jgi:hypothetical protein
LDYRQFLFVLARVISWIPFKPLKKKDPRNHTNHSNQAQSSI